MNRHQLVLAFILCASSLMITCRASASGWPPESGSRVPGNALEYPTKLSPLNVSLEKLLNNGAKVISTSLASDGPVVTVQNGKHYIICLLKGAGSGIDQNVSTSRCYAMN